jgi:hypothetical protein
MMKRIVEKAIPNSGLTTDTIFSWMQNTIVPVLREVRRIINGRFGEVVTVTDDYAAGPNDEIILAQTAAAVVAVTLPPVTECTKTIVVKRTGAGAGNVTVAPHADDTGVTIDTAASVTITTDKRALQFVSDGANWYIVNYSL